MRRLVQRYSEWRGSSIVRHAWFIAATGLTAFSLVVLPGQWVPVLFRDDLTVVGLSLVILGVGTLVAAGSLARRRQFGWRSALVPPLAVGFALVVLAIALYKTNFNGIGWPEAHELVLGLAFVGGCALTGGATGTLSRRCPRVLGSMATAIALVVVGSGGIWLFSYSLPENLEPRYQASEQVCERRNEIEYCANPGYEPFIDYWERVVEAVLKATPVEVDRSDIVVAQLLDEDGGRRGDASAAPGTDWGKGAGRGVAGLGLGLDIANWVTGLEPRLVTFDPNEPHEMCDAGTNARSVVAYWLAGQIDNDVKAVIGDLGCCADAISGSTFAAPSAGGGWDVAEQLLALPASEVRAGIEEHWDELVDPDTPVARVSELFDLGAPEVTQEEGDEVFPSCRSRYD